MLNKPKKAEEEDKSDAELIELAKIDSESFGFLMERYQAPLFRYIRRISQLPNEDAEDLLQEVFIKIYQKLNEYNELLKFSSWAYRIAHNQVIDHFRKMKARPATDNLEDEELAKIFRSEQNEDYDIFNRECAERIRKCIKEIPFKYREILILRFLEEKNYEEIMDILKKPKGSVATLIARGKNILTKNMKKNNPDCFEKI